MVPNPSMGPNMMNDPYLGSFWECIFLVGWWHMGQPTTALDGHNDAIANKSTASSSRWDHQQHLSINSPHFQPQQCQEKKWFLIKPHFECLRYNSLYINGAWNPVKSFRFSK